MNRGITRGKAKKRWRQPEAVSKMLGETVWFHGDECRETRTHKKNGEEDTNF